MTFLFLALNLAVGAVMSAPQAAPAPSVPGRARTLEVAREIMSAARYCTLVTLGAGGQPQARIVDPIPPDGSLGVYVATNPRSRKVAEIRRDDRVTLLYFDAARPAYVTLIGRATEVTGPEKTAHFQEGWRAFFNRDSPETYTLYRISPTRVEVVSAPDGVSGDPVTWRPAIVEFK